MILGICIVYLVVTCILFGIVAVSTYTDETCINPNLLQLLLLFIMCFLKTIPFIFAVIWEAGDNICDYLGNIIQSQNERN